MNCYDDNTDSSGVDMNIPSLTDGITTKKLASMFGVKPETVIKNNYIHGHFRNYVPVAKQSRTLIWENDYEERQW